MKRISLILLVITLTGSSLSAQVVDSIQVEQAGEFIKINYRITNSTAYQLFRVTVFASINGGLKSELVSLVGDVGDHVVGGKNSYTVLWDVLKDVEELNSVDFSVRAELLSDDTPIRLKGAKAKGNGLFIMAAGELPQYAMGGRIGYLGNWGLSVMLLAGKKIDPSTPIEDDAPTVLGSYALSKRIVNTDQYRMHLYAGGVNGSYQLEYYSTEHGQYWRDRFNGFEAGLIFDINKLLLSGGIGILNNLDRNERELTAFFGLGVRF